MAAGEMAYLTMVAAAIAIFGISLAYAATTSRSR